MRGSSWRTTNKGRGGRDAPHQTASGLESRLACALADAGNRHTGLVLFQRASRLWQNQQMTAYETCHQLFRVFSTMTGAIGLMVMIAELAVMLMGLVRLIKTHRKPERSSAGLYWGMLLCGPLFTAGTLFLMVLVRTLTYGMGV